MIAAACADMPASDYTDHCSNDDNGSGRSFPRLFLKFVTVDSSSLCCSYSGVVFLQTVWFADNQAFTCVSATALSSSRARSISLASESMATALGMSMITTTTVTGPNRRDSIKSDSTFLVVLQVSIAARQNNLDSESEADSDTCHTLTRRIARMIWYAAGCPGNLAFKSRFFFSIQMGDRPLA